MKTRIVVVIGAISLTYSALYSAADKASPDVPWPAYGGNPEDNRYSSLKEINTTNVSKLQVAWTYDTQDPPAASETQPIVVNRTLYGVTPTHKVVALDAATGKLKWRFDSGIVGRGPNRGVTYWTSGNEQRIFAAVESFIYALNAQTGEVIKTFGKDGRIDLRDDLGREPSTLSIVLTTPGIIYKDLLIVGGRDPESLPAPPGDIRAYDVRTGKCAGGSIPFRIRVNPVTRLGLKMHGNIAARRTTGQGWPWTKSAASCTFPPAPPPPISTPPTASATTCSPTCC